jgi:hypothetical protein
VGCDGDHHVQERHGGGRELLHHYTYPIAYQTPPITILGGDSLVLSVRDPDNYVNTNHMDNVPADPPPALQVQLQRIDSGMPRWQYVYLEVKSVTRLVP